MKRVCARHPPQTDPNQSVVLEFIKLNYYFVTEKPKKIKKKLCAYREHRIHSDDATNRTTWRKGKIKMWTTERVVVLLVFERDNGTLIRVRVSRPPFVLGFAVVFPQSSHISSRLKSACRVLVVHQPCQCQICSTPLVALFLFAYFQYRNKHQFHSIPLLHIDNNNQLKVAQHLI